MKCLRAYATFLGSACWLGCSPGVGSGAEGSNAETTTVDAGSSETGGSAAGGSEGSAEVSDGSVGGSASDASTSTTATTATTDDATSADPSTSDLAESTGSPGDTSGDTTAAPCDPGTAQTEWAVDCSSDAEIHANCVSGTWTSWGSSSPENYPLRYETEHFAFLWPDERNVDMADAMAAGEFLETTVWGHFMGDPIHFQEPDCTRADKRKVSIHIIADGLFGGCNAGRPGIWVGPGALEDHWGLAHELTHALQCMTPALPDCGAGGCWIFESHANWMAHQLPEYRGNTHCSDMLINMPHLYYGSTRDRYCNWQFLEYIKDRHCYAPVNQIWSASDVPAGLADPLNKLAHAMDWDAEQLNDAFGEWAMHNVTYDYRDPESHGGTDQGPTYRARYGPLTDARAPERLRRITQLEGLDDDWPNHRRFVSPYYWAPQRGGYNIVELLPEPGAESVTVEFRGVLQDEADSGWRFGIVATDSELSSARYSELHGGNEGAVEFCATPGERLWLVVTAAPTVIQKIIWDQPYPSIYRYPYMIEVQGAWPAGFSGGTRQACPQGLEPHENGGGCAPPELAASVFVGPYAQVRGGTVTGDARIEDHAIILDGAVVEGGTVGALTILDRFTVRDEATVKATFYPPGFFESGQGLSGSAVLYGDIEYRGASLNRSSGSFYGFVDANTESAEIVDLTIPPPYAWRP